MLTQKDIEEINNNLLAYTEKHCANCYASLCEDGRLNLDDKFERIHLNNILNIVDMKCDKANKEKVAKFTDAAVVWLQAEHGDEFDFERIKTLIELTLTNFAKK